MALPPPPPGFNLDTPGAPALGGRPIIRKGADPVKPDLPQGYGMQGDTAAPVRGLPAEFTTPDKWERASPNDLKPLGLSGPYLINRKTGDVKLVEVPKTDPDKKVDPQTAALELRNVIDKAFRARELSRKGWLATGFGADLAKKIGGTTAADVDGLLDTISANTAFETLQKMREASPTGGALGAISERELDLLRSTTASLKQGQSDEQFQKSMQDVAEAYGRVLAKIPGGRAMMIQRGWLPKSSTPKAQPKGGDVDAILRQYGVVK